MKRLLFILLPWAFFIAGCCKCGVAMRPHHSSQPVRNKVTAAIIAKTGAEYYSKHFSELSAAILPGTGITEYKFKFDPKLKGAEPVELVFTADSSGAIMNADIFAEVPDYLLSPGKNNFTIDGNAALETAKSNGIPAGIKPLSAQFLFDTETAAYVWRVKTVFAESEGSNGYRGRGVFMFISAVTGEVIRRQDWNVQ